MSEETESALAFNKEEAVLQCMMCPAGRAVLAQGLRDVIQREIDQWRHFVDPSGPLVLEPYEIAREQGQVFPDPFLIKAEVCLLDVIDEVKKTGEGLNGYAYDRALREMTRNQMFEQLHSAMQALKENELALTGQIPNLVPLPLEIRAVDNEPDKLISFDLIQGYALLPRETPEA
jgi:hypothetical protein